MRALFLTGVLAGGGVAGFWHALRWPAVPEVSTVIAPSVPVPRIVEPPCPEPPPPRPESPPPRPTASRIDPSEVGALEARVAALEQQLEDAIGTPGTFPADLDPRFTPEGAGATIQALLDAAGEGELLTLDCSEYPCIASVQAPSRVSTRPFSGPVPTALTELAGDQTMFVGGFRPGMPDHLLVALGPPGDPAAKRRLDYRMSVAVEIENEARAEEWR